MPERKRGANPPDENDLKFGDELPVLPIRNAVLFPGAVALVVFRRRFDRHRDVAGVAAQGAEASNVGPAAS